jgi:hypothetical protein
LLSHEFGGGDIRLNAHCMRLRFRTVIDDGVSRADRVLAGIAPVRARIASRSVDFPLAKGPTIPHFGPDRLPGAISHY